MPGGAKKFFLEKFQMSEAVFRDAVRLILRRRGIKLFNLDSLTDEQEEILIKVFQDLSKEGLEDLVKNDATINILDCVLH